MAEWNNVCIFVENIWDMKKFIKAVVIGYAVLWIFNSIKDMMGENEITSLEDIKKLIKEKL